MFFEELTLFVESRYTLQKLVRKQALISVVSLARKFISRLRFITKLNTQYKSLCFGWKKFLCILCVGYKKIGENSQLFQFHHIVLLFHSIFSTKDSDWFTVLKKREFRGERRATDDGGVSTFSITSQNCYFPQKLPKKTYWQQTCQGPQSHFYS